MAVIGITELVTSKERVTSLNRKARLIFSWDFLDIFNIACEFLSCCK